MHIKRIRHTITKAPVIRPSLSWLYHRRLTASDIFVASYPRAGSTWLRFLLYELLTGQPTSFAAVNQAIPGIGRHFNAPQLIDEARLIQTHEPYRTAYGRAIYLVRDVRDAVISEYHFQQLWQLYDGSFPDFIDDFLAGRVNRYGSWDSHTNSWLDAQGAAPEHILLIRFSDLRRKTRATLARILAFLGTPASDEAIAQAIANNTTHKMRAKESALKFASADQNFVRQGQVGGWQNTLSDEQRLLLEQEAGPTLRRLGYLQAPAEIQKCGTRFFCDYTMRGLKILLAHNRYLIGGGERQVFAAELSLLRNHGHEVDVYIEDNQRIAELGRLHTAARTIWSTETYQNIRNKLRAGQFDVAHVHNFFPLISPSIYYASRAERIPVVQTLHNFRLLCSNGLLFREGVVCEACVGRAVTWPGIIHACYRDSRGGSATVAAMLSFHRAIKTWDRMIDTYIALTEFSRQKFIKGGLPENKIRVKPNFMTSEPEPGSGQGNYALFVGRLSPEKGVETLLAAWRLLGDTVPLKIVGQGPLKDQVVAAAETIPSVEYLGHLENDQVLHIMQDALFLVFPSLLYENFPMTIVEAFASGLAVLASNLGNSANLVQPWQTGLHFKTGDPTDLAKQAAWLVNNRDILGKMRVSARETYEAQLTPDRNYRILSAIYRDTMAKREVGVQNGH